MDDQALREFYADAYPQKHLNSKGHCFFYLTCKPNDPASGYGKVLRGDAKEIVAKARAAAQAGYSLHMLVAAMVSPVGKRPSYSRAELGEGSRHYIVADIDMKEQTLTEAQVLQAFAALALPPTYIINSANGYHLYWMCSDDVSPIRQALPRELLPKLFDPVNVKVDLAVSYRLLGAIRMPGSLGKGGGMVVGDQGIKTGRSYALQELLLAAGFNSQLEAETRETELLQNRSSVDSQSWQSTLNHVDRDRLFQHCPTFTAFVADSATAFGNGQNGTRKDVMMFASLCAHQVDPEKETDHQDLGQHKERYRFFDSVVSQWPGYESNWGDQIYEFAEARPPFACDKWGVFAKHCKGCPAKSIPQANPITFTKDSVTQYLNAAMPVVADPQTLETVSRVNSPAEVLASFTNAAALEQYYLNRYHGRYVSNGEILFRVTPVKDKPAKYTPLCAPPIYLVDDVVARPLNIENGLLCERAVFGQWDPTTETGELFTLTASDLKNPARMSEALLNPKVTVFDPKGLCDYYREASRAAKGEYTVCYQQLGWQNDHLFVTPYCEVHPHRYVNCAMTKDISTLLVDESARAIPAPQGTAQSWADNVMTPLLEAGDNCIPHVTMILSSFASILFRLMPRHGSGPVICLYGHTGRGKTQALRLAMSVWYSPTGTPASARDTAVSTRIRMGAMNNLPVMLDEATNMNPDLAYDLAFELTNSAPRTASANMGTSIREVQTWCNSVLMTSNEAFQATIGNTQMRVDPAALSRVIDIPVPSASDPEAGKLLDAAMAGAAEHYGVVGMEFAHYIMSNRAWVVETLEHYTRKLQHVEKQLLMDGAEAAGSARFRISHMSALLTTANILDAMGLGMNLTPIAEEFGIEYSRTLSRELTTAIREQAVDFHSLINQLAASAMPGTSADLHTWYNALPEGTRLPPPGEQVLQRGDLLMAPRGYVMSLLKKQYQQRGINPSFKTDLASLVNTTKTMASKGDYRVFDDSAVRRRIMQIKNHVKHDTLEKPVILNNPQRVFVFDLKWLELM